MTDKGIKYRKLKDKLFFVYIICGSLIIIVPIFYILYYIVLKGISSINWEFFVSLPSPPGETGGGIANALVGTLILLILSGLFAIAPSIALGIYLSEHRSSKLANSVRLGVEILQSVPSIVIGIIVYIWIVRPLGGFNALSGGIALALMMIPIITKSTEETLKLIPNSLKEASMALGVPNYKTILRIILPAGLSGILNGILIAIARVSGETAPLLFTAFGNPFMSTNILKPINNLPLLIFNYAGSPYKDWHALAWGASFVLVVFVLLMNIIAKIIAKRWKVQF
ncbi:MAG: phosphate ABC transporter permease PstA [FCB group bacterium]|jgi:phosphate transport system permease protein